MLRPVADIAEAQWIVDGLGQALRVGGVIPAGFERHARILHPGWRVEDGVRTPVRWADMAERSGRPSHRLSHWSELSGMPLIDEPAIEAIVSAGGVVIDRPDEGRLPEAVAKPLREVLARHVMPSESCWFGVWTGFASPYKPEIPTTSSIDAGFREWDLFKGPIDAVGFQFFQRENYTANVIWPNRRTWFVSTDIDLETTYVGGSAALIGELLEAQGLEAVEAHPDDPVAPSEPFAHNDNLIRLVRQQSRREVGLIALWRRLLGGPRRP